MSSLPPPAAGGKAHDGKSGGVRAHTAPEGASVLSNAAGQDHVCDRLSRACPRMVHDALPEQRLLSRTVQAELCPSDP
ncbi:hypothetical protein GCM10010219_50480 [Streptomyces netropsis]|nr:hypothetical protein GCM10010219_50480 [Streptomyces netropsis]